MAWSEGKPTPQMWHHWRHNVVNADRATLRKTLSRYRIEGLQSDSSWTEGRLWLRMQILSRLKELESELG